ncbi:MAG: amidohydrolase [Phycisphaerae bacterium]|nr:amidohydrolase [Phycisphaerae bacterium]
MHRAAKELTLLRQELHGIAELSGHEEETAAFLRDYLLRTCAPDDVVTNLGGSGLAAVYSGRAAGPTVLLRSELDALPIPESRRLEYASRTDGVSHKCGHDGHMAILAGVAAVIGATRPGRGRIVLLFQPAEETGDGAARVLADERFAALAPDMVFALHNLPGYALGSVVTRVGVFASTSEGFIAEFKGQTSHAAEPHRGRSPAPAIAQMINGLNSLAQLHTPLHAAAQVTVIHASVGEAAFGTSPGEGKVLATLRAHTDETMSTLRRECERLAASAANAFGLEHIVRWVEPFPYTRNHPYCAQLITDVAHELGLPVVEPDVPFAWTEDFGHFTHEFRGAMFGLGAGEDCPVLHHPHYDFPDELIPVGIRMFRALVDRALAEQSEDTPAAGN